MKSVLTTWSIALLSPIETLDYRQATLESDFLEGQYVFILGVLLVSE